MASTSSPAPAIGIDLGTNNSRVAVHYQDDFITLQNEYGSFSTSSEVAFTKHESLFDHGIVEDYKSTNIIFGAKRLIGRKFEDATVQADIKHWPFEVVNVEGQPKIKVVYKGEQKLFFPEEISAMVLTKMQNVVSTFLSKKVTRAVVTVPANFTDSQRQATLDAGKIAGLDVLKIINEPSAAALAYWRREKNLTDIPINALTLSVGAGSCDVSISQMSKESLCVLATAGDTHLGGEDFDNRLMAHLIDEFKTKHNVDLSSTCALNRLKRASKFAKEKLSVSFLTSITLQSLHEGIDFDTDISRFCFDELNSDLFTSILELVKKVLGHINMDKSEIQKVYLIGGSTRVPKIQTLLQNFFGSTNIIRSINHDAPALGAAIQAAILENKLQCRFTDVTPLPLGIEAVDGIDWLFERNTTYPIETSRAFTTTNVVRVIEGGDNYNFLGEVRISPPVRPCPVTVIFKIDLNGLVKVITYQVPISIDKGRLTGEALDNAVKQAKQLRLQDMQTQSRIQAMHSLQTVCKELICKINHDRMERRVSQIDVDYLTFKCNQALKWANLNNDNADKKTCDLRKKNLYRGYKWIVEDGE